MDALADLALAIYGPLIDQIGGWVMGVIVIHRLGVIIQDYLRWLSK